MSKTPPTLVEALEQVSAQQYSNPRSVKSLRRAMLREIESEDSIARLVAIAERMIDKIRPAPVANEIEEEVLGAMLVSKKACKFGLEELTQDDFFLPKHFKLFRSLRRMTRDNVPTDDFTALIDWLRSHLLLIDMGGPKGVYQIAKRAASGSSIAYFINRLRIANVERKMWESAEDIFSQRSRLSVSEWLRMVKQEVAYIEENARATVARQEETKTKAASLRSGSKQSEERKSEA